MILAVRLHLLPHVYRAPRAPAAEHPPGHDPQDQDDDHRYRSEGSRTDALTHPSASF
jgi:hypothetical protein